MAKPRRAATRTQPENPRKNLGPILLIGIGAALLITAVILALSGLSKPTPVTAVSNLSPTRGPNVSNIFPTPIRGAATAANPASTPAAGPVRAPTQTEALSAQSATATPALFDIPFPNIERISVEDAKRAQEEGTAVIVDVRDPGTFASLHIAGSINLPLSELETRFTELPKDRWIVTVCT